MRSAEATPATGVATAQLATTQVATTRVRSATLRTVVGLLLGAILVGTFLRLVNLRAVSHHLAHLNVGFAVACGASFLMAYAVRAVRWRFLLRPYRVSVRRAVAIYQVATFLNWLLPVQGGEIAKSLLLRRTDGIPVSRSLATVSMDKTMDLLPAMGLLMLAPFLGLHLSRLLWVLLLVAMSIVLGGVMLVAFVVWRRERAVPIISRLLAAMLPRRVRERVEPFVAQFVETLGALMRRPRLLLLAIACTAVALCFDGLFCLLAFKAVAVAVTVPTALYGYTFFNLAFILPTPPGHVGTNEVVGLLIFSGVFRVSRSSVGAMFLFAHPWTGILLTGTGLACMSRMGLSLRSSLRLTQQAESEVRTG